MLGGAFEFTVYDLSWFKSERNDDSYGSNLEISLNYMFESIFEAKLFFSENSVSWRGCVSLLIDSETWIELGILKASGDLD